MENNWQRIEKVVKWAGLSVNSFALAIGLNRAENLYQIKKGNNGISRELASMIVARYPQINKGWVLTGEGDMFTDDTIQRTSIPFYDVDAESYVVAKDKYQTKAYIALPMIEKSEFATRYFGRAMGESIPPGSIVIFRQIDIEMLIPGSECLVLCDRLTTLRKVRRSLGSNQLLLEPVDKENFDEVLVDEREVRELYLVKAVINIKTV